MSNDVRPMASFAGWLVSLASRALQAYAQGSAVYLHWSGYDNPQSWPHEAGWGAKP
jgi:hypothetical protein